MKFSQSPVLKHELAPWRARLVLILLLGSMATLVGRSLYLQAINNEFLIGKGSNAGIKFHAMYEIQIHDTPASKTKLTGDDMGGIYPRAEDKPKYHHGSLRSAVSL